MIEFCSKEGAMGAPALTFGGAKGQEKSLGAKKNLKRQSKHTKKIYLLFYTEIIKFGLILIHLSLFGGKLGGKKIFFGLNTPLHTPCHHHWEGARKTFNEIFDYRKLECNSCKVKDQ